MGGPNDFTPKTVTLTTAQKRKLAQAAANKRYGTNVKVSTSDAQIETDAYAYLQKLMSTQGGSSELQSILGDEAPAIISAYAQSIAPKLEARPFTPISPSGKQPTYGAMPPGQDVYKALSPEGAENLRPRTAEEIIRQEAPKLGIPIEVALAVFDIEGVRMPDGSWKRGARVAADPSGFLKEGDQARGPLQVMPGHFRELGVPESMWDDERTGIQVGLGILRNNFDQTQDWRKAAGRYFGEGTDPTSGVNTEGYQSRFDQALAKRAGQPGAGEEVPGQPSSTGAPTRFLADIIGQKDPWAQYEEAMNQLAMMPPKEKYAQDEDGRPMLDGSGSNYLLSPEAMRLQELAGMALDMARYGPKATGQNDIDAWVEGFKKYTGRNPTEQELLQKFGVGAGGTGRDEVGLGNLEMRRKEFEYGQGQDVLARQDALQKERNAIMKAKAEAEQYLADLEAQGQRDYMKASEWMIPAGRPVPKSPDFPGLPGLDLNNYLVPTPDFQAPVRTARERIAAELAGMKAGV